MIKSAISRQREFLADASSVQFTRNPGGIAGALKKIGGLADGSRIRDAPRRGDQPHVLRRRLCRLVVQSLRHAPAAGGSHPALGARIRRPFSRGPAGGGRAGAAAAKSAPFRRALASRRAVLARRHWPAAAAMALDARERGAADRPAANGTPPPCRPDRGRHAASAAGCRPRAVLPPRRSLCRCS